MNQGAVSGAYNSATGCVNSGRTLCPLWLLESHTGRGQAVRETHGDDFPTACQCCQALREAKRAHIPIGILLLRRRGRGLKELDSGNSRGPKKQTKRR